jgi:hypothetical protein
MSVWLHIMELGTHLEVVGYFRIAVALSSVHTGGWVDLRSAFGAL